MYVKEYFTVLNHDNKKYKLINFDLNKYNFSSEKM